MATSSREVIARLRADGWELHRTKGSHNIFKHPQKSGHVTVPHPKHDLPVGTVRNIYKQAGLDPREDKPEKPKTRNGGKS